MGTLSEFIEDFKNASEEERLTFVKSLLQDKNFVKMHLFELMTPAQFEITKRIGKGFL
jgi:hypothetical protein